MAIDRRPDRPKPWRARYWGPDGRQHSRSFARKAEAQRWLAEVEHDKTRGHWTNPALGRVRFSAWVEEWQETTNNVRPTTAVRDRMLLDRYLLPRFGPLPLASLSQRDVRAWVTELSAKGLAPATVHKCYQVLTKILAAAVERGHDPSLAVPADPAAQDRAGRDAVPDRGRGPPPGGSGRAVLSGADPARRLWRPADRGDGRAAPQAPGPDRRGGRGGRGGDRDARPSVPRAAQDDRRSASGWLAPGWWWRRCRSIWLPGRSSRTASCSPSPTVPRCAPPTSAPECGDQRPGPPAWRGCASMTCGTRRSRCGSRPGLVPRRSRPGPGTPR